MSELKWIRTKDKKPPLRTHVLFWFAGQDGWRHGYRDTKRYYEGDEGFTMIDEPTWWAMPEGPE